MSVMTFAHLSKIAGVDVNTNRSQFSLALILYLGVWAPSGMLPGFTQLQLRT
jgi:hypothetical protein